jgi:hypothetical protein
MTPATLTPSSGVPAGLQGPSFQTAFLGFFVSNLLVIAAMVLLGSVGG